MIVTTTDFKTHVSRYLSLVADEEILITKNGRNIAKLMNARNGNASALHSLRGILKDSGATRDAIREGRLAKYDEGTD
jgi:prevent-host-death family protein